MISLEQAQAEAKKKGNVIPLAVEFPADLLTPVSAFLRLSRTGRKAFLLESVEGGERLARYSFLGVDPFATLRIENGQLRIADENGIDETLSGNPFVKIGEYLSAFKSVPRPGLPPFSGGAVGYLGSECFRYLEKIPVSEQRISPYDAQLMLFREVIAFDHVRHRVILISNLLTDREELAAGLARAKGKIEDLRRELSLPSPEEKPFLRSIERIPEPSDKPESLPRALFGKKRFCQAVKTAKEHIRAGDIFQCVLSEQFSLPMKVSPFLIYRALRNISPSPYLFYLTLGEEVLLGASPEMLTRVDSGTVETCPIAGTRPRGRTPAEDKKLEAQLLASVKEKAEHLMLVDLGRNDIGRISRPGSVSVKSFMEVQRFSHVMHLVSQVQGRLKHGKSAWEALGSCFPAGTLSGAPKIRALEIIARLEPAQRGPYGGVVVYHDFSGKMDSCITIRSLFVREGRGYLRAGAGIVADSNPAREYQEVLNKTKALRKAIALAEQ